MALQKLEIRRTLRCVLSITIWEPFVLAWKQSGGGAGNCWHMLTFKGWQWRVPPSERWTKKGVIYIFNKHSQQCTFWLTPLFSLRALCCFYGTEGGQPLPSLNENLYQEQRQQKRHRDRKRETEWRFLLFRLPKMRLCLQTLTQWKVNISTQHQTTSFVDHVFLCKTLINWTLVLFT